MEAETGKEIPAGRNGDPAEAPDFTSIATKSFAQLLRAGGISLAVSTYQSGKVIIMRARDEVLHTHFRHFQNPMGLAYRGGFLAVGALNEVWKFRNLAALGAQVDKEHPNDATFLPAARYTTGDIRIHELGWCGEEIWAVNTRFSCLCTFDGKHHFVPRWRPPFVSAYAADDRCHLNGMEIVNDKPALVTCHGTSDEGEGWRGQKIGGGCILDVESGRALVSGLCMPHSPRLHRGRLWFLESGEGRVCSTPPEGGEVTIHCTLPGFTRGLDFHGRYAFIGLSQVRETAVFGGVPISEEGRERQCGVWIVDLESGETVGFLQFSGTVREIFAVCVLPYVWPDIIPQDDELVANTFYVPQELLSEFQVG